MPAVGLEHEAIMQIRASESRRRVGTADSSRLTADRRQVAVHHSEPRDMGSRMTVWNQGSATANQEPGTDNSRRWRDGRGDAARTAGIAYCDPGIIPEV